MGARSNHPANTWHSFILLVVLTGDFSLNLSHHMEVTAMTENILETIRKGVQDFVEVRQLKEDFGG